MTTRNWHHRGQNHSDSLERALEVCEDAFYAIVDKTTDGVIVIDTHGTICFANAAAEAMLGRSTGELLGEPIGIPAVAGKTTEVNLLHKGVAVRVAEMRVADTEWQGNPAFLATLRDITERKEAEQKAREAVRRRDEFLAILSHELRNPLAAISNAATVLASSGLDSATFEQARTVIERQCGQMTRLLEDLLDVSRVTRSKIELRKECIDFLQVVTEAVDAFRGNIERAGQRLKVELPSAPVAVDGDAVRLQQVLVNLLSNASKYSRANGSIELLTTIEGNEVVIRVVDHGVGLSPEMLEAVFEPFVQLGSTLHRADGGLGLGLAIVDGLVRLHGGTVQARSAGRGKGSEFTVRLPISKSQPKKPRPLKAVVAEGSLRILLVEDNSDVRSMLKTLLEFSGHDVEVAEDGLKGAEMIEFQRPDVAIVDIGLPDLDGYALASRIRAIEECHDVFLVALTGYGQPRDRRKAISSGFDAHLAKPVDLSQLRQILSSVRESKQQPSDVR